jgi:hypothetical protein
MAKQAYNLEEDVNRVIPKSRKSRSGCTEKKKVTCFREPVA